MVPVQMTNYEDTQIRFTLRLRDQTKVILKPGMEVRLKNNVLTYGETLSKLLFEDAVFTDEDGNVIEGTFGWPDGSWVPYAGIPVGTWQFKPADAAYESVYGSVPIVVNQAAPAIETPAAVAERTYDPTKTLEDSDLTGGVVTGVDGAALKGTWSWKQAGIIPTVNNSGYEAVFTETGTKNYTAVSTTVEVKVKKAEPEVDQNPTAAEITWGESLADAVLSGGTMRHSVSGTAVSGSFAWKDATIRPNVADSDQTGYTVVFTPDDTENYETTETTVTLHVKRVGNTPNLPANRIDVPYDCKKVKDVQLPDGWAWADADRETELVAGTAVHATAVYIGEGAGNYETESVTIAITRLACSHANTEVRDAKEAGYGSDGYTGDTFCKDCGVLLEKGKTVAALTHSGNGGGNTGGTSGNAGGAATAGTGTTGKKSGVAGTTGGTAGTAGNNADTDTDGNSAGTIGNVDTDLSDSKADSSKDGKEATEENGKEADASGSKNTDDTDTNDAENNRNQHVSLFAIIAVVIAAGTGIIIVLIGKKRRKREDETEQ